MSSVHLNTTRGFCIRYSGIDEDMRLDLDTNDMCSCEPCCNEQSFSGFQSLHIYRMLLDPVN